MKAFIVDRYGKKDQGRIGEMPDPGLRENDVLVQVILPYRLPPAWTP